MLTTRDQAIRRSVSQLLEKVKKDQQVAFESGEVASMNGDTSPISPRSCIAAMGAAVSQNLPSRPVTVRSKALPTEFRALSTDIDEVNRQKSAWDRAVDSFKKIKPKPRGQPSLHDQWARDLQEIDWHTVLPHLLIQRLQTSPINGLSAAEAARRLQENGPNAPSPPKTNRARIIVGYLFQGFGGILLVGSLLVFVSWKPLGEPPSTANLALGIVLLAVFVIQASFAVYQNLSTTKVMSSIENMLPGNCEVLRDGHPMTLAAKDLVMGDMVKIKAGNKVPADLRWIKTSFDVKFDRSVLTGEPIPVSACVQSTDQNYLETRNMGLQGTHCMVGSATGIVVATGDATVFGRIAALTNCPKAGTTTLEREVRFFVYTIFTIMFLMIMVVITIWAGFLRSHHPTWINVPTLIVDCVSVAVAFIPEGLPIAMTAGLTIIAHTMRKSKILCKSLKTVETLGAVSVVCSDKTGTLTEGRMTVTTCVVEGQGLTVQEARAVSTSPARGIGATVLGALSTLCNAGEVDNSTIHHSDPSMIKVFGDPTDTAILRFSEEMKRGNILFFRACWQMIFELAFSSKYKFMMRCFINLRPESLAQTMPWKEAQAFQPQDVLLTIKGAPDILIPRCSHYITAGGGVEPLGALARRRIEILKDRYSAQGQRCIVLAEKIVRDGCYFGEPGAGDFEDAMIDETTEGLLFVGLVGIVDPLRPKIKDVVSTLRSAGIRVAMVTGDFALTALTVAREAGIVTTDLIDDATALQRTPRSFSLYEAPPAPPNDDVKGSALVISGPELLELSDDQWRELVKYPEIVFARTTPEQKLKIVRQFQIKNVVAMTGDGVNDAPSLKAADVGICMGSGSDIALEAADMILLDSFSSIVEAVSYGRVVFDNLKKVIAYLLPAGSFSEFWPVITCVALGLPQILSSFLMIVICCLTDCLAATMLAYERAEADVLLRRPRDLKKDRLLNWQLIFHAYGIIGVIETTASFTMSFWYLERRGIFFKYLLFSFGELPPGIDKAYYDARLVEASSIYFVNLVVMQWFNLLATRTRRLSIFQHPPMLNKATQNLYLFPAMLFAFVMAVFFLYVPLIQDNVGTSGVPVEYWFLPVTFGLLLMVIDEVRRYCARRWPRGIVARMAW